MGIYSHKYMISFDDVSQNLKVKDIALMRYLVDAAGMHSESVGYGLTTLNKTNIIFLLTGWKVKILDRPRLLDEIEVKTWAESLSHSLSTRNFEVYSHNNLVAKASTKWIMVSPKDHSIVPVTSDVLNAYGPVNTSVFDTPISKIKIPEKIDKSFEYTIMRRDIDSNKHVNNLKYLELAFELISDEDFPTDGFSEIHINYKNECKLSNKIVCNYTKISTDEHIIAIHSHDLSKTHAVIYLKK